MFFARREVRKHASWPLGYYFTWATVATAVSVRGGSCSDRVVLGTKMSHLRDVFFLLSRVKLTSARCSVAPPVADAHQYERLNSGAETRSPARSMWANGH